MSNFRENGSVNNKCLKHKVTYFQQLMTTPHVGKALPLCIFLLPANSFKSSSSLLFECMHSLFLCRDDTGSILVFEKSFFTNTEMSISSLRRIFPRAVALSLKTQTAIAVAVLTTFTPWCYTLGQNFHIMLFKHSFAFCMKPARHFCNISILARSLKIGFSSSMMADDRLFVCL